MKDKKEKLEFLPCLILSLVWPIVLLTTNASSMPPHPDLIKKYAKEDRTQELTLKMHKMRAMGINKQSAKAFPLSGNKKVLVILIGFSDLSLDAGSTTAFYDNLFNEHGASLTLNKYYKDMSNNALDLAFTIIDAGQAAQALNYYGQNGGFGNDAHPAELAAEAVDLAAAGVNFSDFDNDGDGKIDTLVVIHAGRGEESGAASNTIWSHSWSLSSAGIGTITKNSTIIDDYIMVPEYVFAAGDSTIGILCHEFGHALGLPDLYDTTYSTYGVGDWSPMASGAWLGPGKSGAGLQGSRPAPLMAWEKTRLGWLSAQNAAIGPNTIADIESSHTALKIPLTHADGGSGVNGPSLLRGFLNLASLPLLGISLVPGVSAVFFLRKRKKNIRYILSLFLIFVFPLIMFITSGCQNQDSKHDPILSILAASNSPEPIPSEQYYLLENKVITPGTWTECLPGNGLLITHIDVGLIDLLMDFNMINSPKNMHGVNIKEADGNNALWHKSDRGASTDPYYSAYALSPSTNPNTNYYTWAYNLISGYLYIYNNHLSGVAINNISSTGPAMTFQYARE